MLIVDFTIQIVDRNKMRRNNRAKSTPNREDGNNKRNGKSVRFSLSSKVPKQLMKSQKEYK